MKRSTLTAAALPLLLAAAAAADAQSEAALPVPGVHQVGLLLLPDVQKELKVDEKQAADVRALAGRIQEFMIKSMQEVQARPLKDRMAGLEAMNARLAADTREGIAAILAEPQRARLRQISLQERGGMSFAEPEVQDGLRMSENQKARVRSQVNETFLKIRQSAVASGNDRQAILNKAQALRKELADAIIGEMSDEQRALWKEMIGEPFVVKFEPSPAPAPAPAAPATPR